MSKILSDFNSQFKVSSNVATSNVFSDLDLRLIKNPITNDINPLTDIDAVRTSIKNLVLTGFFDRPFEPTLGSNVNQLLFEPATTLTAYAIRSAIIKVINNNEPRANNVTVQIADYIDENAYKITVGFTVHYNSTVNEVDFFLTRLR